MSTVTSPVRVVPLNNSAFEAVQRIVRRANLLAHTDPNHYLWCAIRRHTHSSSPAIADGRVYGLDLASGKKVWEYEAASPVTSSPAVAKGKVVVATADGQVICFG
jgi:outer membrane protein assembly factor BamB